MISSPYLSWSMIGQTFVPPTVIGSGVVLHRWKASPEKECKQKIEKMKITAISTNIT